MSHQKHLIIVEGIDRSGKGTLIDNLRKLILSPWQTVIHSSKPPLQIHNSKKWDYKEWAYEYNSSLMINVNNMLFHDDIVILDRSFIGEFVYGPMYRNVYYDSEHVEQYTNYFLSELDDDIKISIVFCEVNDWDKYEHRKDGNEDASKIEDSKKEQEKFYDILAMLNNNTRINNIIYNKWHDEDYKRFTFANTLLHKIGYKNNDED